MSAPDEGAVVDLTVLAARALARPARLGGVRLVCVDGPAGSGKTMLAAGLADAATLAGAAVHVVHMDDLYEGWSGLGRAWPRVEAQVLEPLGRGEPGRWQRYDWVTGRFAEWHDLAVPDVLVLEGCGSAPRAVDGRASLLVWVEVPPDLRLRRGLTRDGEAMRDRWLAWSVAEEAHFAAERTRDRADVVVDGRARLDP